MDRLRGMSYRPSMDLQSRIEAVASKFAAELVEIMKQASLQELMSFGNVEPPRQERTPRSVQAYVSEAPAPKKGWVNVEDLSKQVVRLLRNADSGMRTEDIRTSLNADKAALGKVLKAGLEDKTFKRKGEKRATTYFLA